MILKLPKIYPITDVDISGLSHTEQLRSLLAGGASFIQLREKTRPAGAWTDDAAEAVKLAHAGGARVIINDRVDIAMAVGADGVHLGQDDLPPAEARRLMGEAAIIGLSTHSLEQVRTARDLDIDYLAFGPIFPTATKPDHDPVVGLDLLRKIRTHIGEKPLVAIGGITDANVASVLAAGADSAAVIGAILSDPALIGESYSRITSTAEKR